LITGFVKLVRGNLSSEETKGIVAELDEEVDHFADLIALRLAKILTTREVSHLPLDLAADERAARVEVNEQKRGVDGKTGND
jgi:hypothetical protein